MYSTRWICAALLLGGLPFATGCGKSTPDIEPLLSREHGAAKAPVAKPAKPAKPNPAKRKKPGTYGDPISAKAPEVTLSALVAKPGDYANKTVRTEGRVKAVCQSRGCWLELADPKGQAHVKLAGHRFFVPRNSKGKWAKVEAKVMPPKAPKGHCEEEAEEATGKVAKVQLVATGVELVAKAN